MSPKTAVPAPRPLRLALLGPPRDVSEGRLSLVLAGHASSPLWLPAKGWPELADARREHVRRVARAQAAIDELGELSSSFTAEDRDYAEALKRAARVGDPPPPDERTRPGEREELLERATDIAWATACALAECVQETLALVAQQEETILARLRQERVAAEDQRREAERLLAQAKAREWRLSMQARWLEGVASGGPMSSQPAPALDTPAPEAWSPHALERAWHRAPVPAAPAEDDGVEVIVEGAA